MVMLQTLHGAYQRVYIILVKESWPRSDATRTLAIRATEIKDNASTVIIDLCGFSFRKLSIVVRKASNIWGGNWRCVAWKDFPLNILSNRPKYPDCNFIAWCVNCEGIRSRFPIVEHDLDVLLF